MRASESRPCARLLEIAVRGWFLNQPRTFELSNRRPQGRR